MRRYFCREDRCTVTESISLFARVEELMYTHQDDLLLKHRLLTGKDFEDLGKGIVMHRQYWIANMKSSISALCQVQNGTVVNGSMPRLMHRRSGDSHTRRSLGLVIYRLQCRQTYTVVMDTASVT